MSKQDNLTDFLTDVADAIREKKGTTEKINPQNFSEEIKGIESGGDEYEFMCDLDMMRDTLQDRIESPSRTYLFAEVERYSSVIVKIKSKSNIYRFAVTCTAENAATATAIYDTGWLFDADSPLSLCIFMSSSYHKYLRFAFTGYSNTGNVSFDELKRNYDIEVYGKRLFLEEGISRIAPLGAIYDGSITLPHSVTVIEGKAFYSAVRLKEIICLSTMPPVIIDRAITIGTILYVPDESVEVYKSSTNWSEYADNIKPLSEYQPTTE